MERFINILIIDDDEKTQRGLKEILAGSGNNILLARDIYQALPVLKQKEIGIILINIDSPFFGGMELLASIKENSAIKNVYKIVICENSRSGAKLVKGLSEGAVDYITKPFNPNLVKAKIEVFKTLYFKDQRIGQLLSNIFPENVLEDLNTYGKFSPKRIDKGVVMFTDFVDFSSASKKIKPIALLRKLEYYFTRFDEIMERYKLEKIKTIGDAYMALGGVTENHAHPAIRACLAALEIRNFMINEKELAQAIGKDYWEIRVGIHMGPLVAGIIGSKKFSFDVWGDTVNIASRAEQSTENDTISITNKVLNEVGEYFDITPRGRIEIKKRGGTVEMFFLDRLKAEHCLYGEGKIAATHLRSICGLEMIDFEQMRVFIINKLKVYLPDELVYHTLSHTLNVEKAAIRYAKLEGLTESELNLLRTAVLYHDSGFILNYDNNEKFAVQMTATTLERFGYSKEQIRIVNDIILATMDGIEPVTLMQQIMCDADHDYFGRADYHTVARKLRIEMENYGRVMDDAGWIEFQLSYLDRKHVFYTETAKNIRTAGKNARIQELKEQLSALVEAEE